MMEFIFFMVLLGTAKALSDLSSEGVIYPKSFSWRRKWKLDQNGDIIPFEGKAKWYYLFSYKPLYVERFAYSSTFLVNLTDFFHAIETIRFAACVGAILTYSPIISYYNNHILNIILDVVIIWAIRTIAFTITYETTKREL